MSSNPPPYELASSCGCGSRLRPPAELAAEIEAVVSWPFMAAREEGALEVMKTLPAFFSHELLPRLSLVVAELNGRCLQCMLKAEAARRGARGGGQA